MYDFNFLPSVEVGTVGRGLFFEFMNHPSFEIFDYDKENFQITNQRPTLKVNVENLNKYVKFLVKVRSRVDGDTFIHRTKMVPCTPEMYE